jgi:hypothetical protein
MSYTKIIKDNPFVEMGATYFLDKPVNFNYHSDELINIPSYVSRQFFNSISGLKLLLQVDKGITSGLENPVSSWLSQSENYVAIQGTSISKPILTADVQNSLPMLLFDGINDYLYIDLVANIISGTGKEFTIWGVFKQLDNVAANQYQVLCGGYGLTTGSYADIELTMTGSTGSGPIIETNSDMGQYSNDGQLLDTFTDGLVHIIIAVFTSNVLKLYVDGIPRSGGTVPSAELVNPPQTITIDTYSLGAFRDSAGSSLFYHGYLGDNGLYDRALSEGEVEILNTGLMTRWGL